MKRPHRPRKRRHSSLEFAERHGKARAVVVNPPSRRCIGPNRWPHPRSSAFGRPSHDVRPKEACAVDFRRRMRPSAEAPFATAPIATSGPHNAVAKEVFDAVPVHHLCPRGNGGRWIRATRTDTTRTTASSRRRSVPAVIWSRATAGPPGAANDVFAFVRAKLSTTDGPFRETKEQFGGYYLIEARDLKRSDPVAARIPGARLGVCRGEDRDSALRNDADVTRPRHRRGPVMTRGQRSLRSLPTRPPVSRVRR